MARPGMSLFVRRAMACVALIVFALGTTSDAADGQVTPAPAAQPLDVIIRNGTVVDGSGRPRYRADVGVRADRIVAIGDLAAMTAPTTIDATGLMVAPGFINIHSHAAANALPTAINMLTQGVATEIVNADGRSPDDFEIRLAQLEARGLAVNVGGYVGFNSAWQTAVGRADRRATDAEIEQMRTYILGKLRTGAWGVSAGLDYVPGVYATTEEVIRAVSVAAPWRTNFPNHDRLTPDSNFSSRVGIAETIAIGEAAGLMPVITHMKVQGREKGTASTILDMMSAATARGVPTAGDVYPYVAGMTGLGSLTIPAWFWEGSAEDIEKRMADPALFERAVREGNVMIAARFGGPESVLLPATGKRLDQIMADTGAASGAEAILRLIEKDMGGPAILTFGAESDVAEFLRYPDVAVSCDCGATEGSQGHPRFYGTFPRVLGRTVRDMHAMSWESAIRGMTAVPANIVGMVDRGFIGAGMIADIVVFDTATVIDHATYDNPTLPSDGIRHVLVGGRVALRDGQSTREHGGRALFRTGHMPSRLVSADVRRSVRGGRTAGTASGNTGEHGSFSFDVSQGPADQRARGRLRIELPARGIALVMRDFGELQATPEWASITGVAIVEGSQEERALTVIIEIADPLLPGQPPSLTVQLDGMADTTEALGPGMVDVAVARLPVRRGN